MPRSQTPCHRPAPLPPPQPSVWQEPFGRVAAEAMINAIPPIVMAIRARQIAEERYSEEVSRKRHVDYFTSLRPESARSGITSTHS
jgi:hypothetical protein